MKLKVREIYECLNAICGFDLQESWDNSGLNIGSLESSVSEIYTCLEVDEDIAKEVHPHSLIISHHPLIFKPLKSFLYDSYPSNIAKILIEKNCSLICMHTNFDSTHLNAYFAKDILGFEHLRPNGISLSGNIGPIEFESLLKNISKKMGLKSLKYSKNSDMIDYVAIVCGAGSSHLYSANLGPNSCLITGDIKYHDGMIARSHQISLIEIEHYHSEKFFPEIMKSILKTKGYQAIIRDSKNPFTYL